MKCRNCGGRIYKYQHPRYSYCHAQEIIFCKNTRLGFNVNWDKVAEPNNFKDYYKQIINIKPIYEKDK